MSSSSSRTVEAPRMLRNNGLTLAMFGLFALSGVGHALTGWHAFNADASAHGHGALALGAYLGRGHYLESVFENWESEFLQMAMFVLLTVWLRQRGSAESISPDDDGYEEVQRDPRLDRDKPGAPWPVRAGGAILVLYEHSLSLALFTLFAVSFALHGVFGWKHQCEEAAVHGAVAPSLGDYVSGAQFWFESFQNWQSEFLSVGALIVLSVFLRERGSSQSKPVSAPHRETESK